MVTLTADVTQGIKELTKGLVDKGIYKSQSEVVRDAIRQLALKYKVEQTHSDIREKITASSKKSGKTLSKTVEELRAE